MEYERPRQEPAVQRDVSTEAFRQFVVGLQVMSTDFDSHVQNFAWCAGQIAEDPNAEAQLRGMMEFALQLQRFGMESALKAVQKNSGVPVRVTIPESRTKKRPGLIVGLTGARYVGRQKIQKIFDGIAVITNSRGQDAFVQVGIKPNGETILQLSESFKIKAPETARLMIDLYSK